LLNPAKANVISGSGCVFEQRLGDSPPPALRPVIAGARALDKAMVELK